MNPAHRQQDHAVRLEWGLAGAAAVVEGRRTPSWSTCSPSPRP
ncbi:MAG: hypothetical protein R2731_00675 [Nocardioides sp.]